MTEIQFLVDLLLNHKHQEAVKNKLIARIGEAETNLSIKPQAPRPQAPLLQQAPSTQALLERDGMPLTATAGIPPQARIVGGQVDTGSGTKGPRKF